MGDKRMIWSDWMLRKACDQFDLVSPYNPECINPASIDLCIAPNYIDLETGETLESDEIVIEPGMAILASTIEYVCIPRDAAATVYLKSSMARLGLDHALAGWVDPGFEGTLTLELHAHRPVVLTAGQRVVQLVLMEMAAEPEQAYQGRYQGQTGPTEAR
jgi:dCTP deaminase